MTLPVAHGTSDPVASGPGTPVTKKVIATSNIRATTPTVTETPVTTTVTTGIKEPSLNGAKPSDDEVEPMGADDNNTAVHDDTTITEVHRDIVVSPIKNPDTCYLSPTPIPKDESGEKINITDTGSANNGVPNKASDEPKKYADVDKTIPI